jgi:cytochrome c oxidase cbb3-type subunit III
LSTDEPTETPLRIDPVASRWIFLGMLVLVAGGALAYNLAKRPEEPPPAKVAKDPLLNRGRSIYLVRCVTCHGRSGRGDGPIAKDLPGPRVGNFTDATWKHGDRPEHVAEVIARGAPGTAMSAWKDVLEPQDIRAVSAYVFYLAGRPVPDSLRTP